PATTISRIAVSATILLGRRLGRDQLLNFAEELLDGFRALIAVFAVADRDLAALLLAVTDYQHERNLLQLGFANLEIDLFAALIDGRADSGGHETITHHMAVFELAIGDRQNSRLHRSEPHGEGAGVVLDQDAEEALDRAEQRAMDHERLMLSAVLGDVFEAEAARQSEVELNR